MCPRPPEKCGFSCRNYRKSVVFRAKIIRKVYICGVKSSEKCEDMLYRKIESFINEFYSGENDKILIVAGARQVGKSFIVRHTLAKRFANFMEINLVDDYDGPRLFENVRSTEDFYLTVGAIDGARLGSYDDTIIFLDEIQKYPHMLTLLKFLRQEHRYHVVASGSLLGVTLKSTTSIPIGSIEIKNMYPLDFEEFLVANNCGQDVIDAIKNGFADSTSLPEPVHQRIMFLFKRYLLVGGMPEAVNEYLKSRNIGNIRAIQMSIHRLYAIDASQYDKEHRLLISRMYSLIPSNMENKKKRMVYKEIEDKRNKRAAEYLEEIDYLVSSGVALEVKAVANPSFPLPESGVKNLLKLYLNDVGMLTALLYRNNISAVLNDDNSVNLGSVYENVVAMELAAQGFSLYYYDNKKNGEVDYLIDDYTSSSSLPLEVKSGKDYTVHSALTKLIGNPDYRVKRGVVLSNERQVYTKDGVTYMPVYYAMGFGALQGDPDLSL